MLNPKVFESIHLESMININGTADTVSEGLLCEKKGQVKIHNITTLWCGTVYNLPINSPSTYEISICQSFA